MKKTSLMLTVIVASLGGLLFGYDTGVITGTQLYFSKYFELTPVMKGFVVGSALIGCFVGAIVSGYISAMLGRKKSLMISAVLFTISAWGSGLPSFFPESVSLLVVFRLIGGIGIGIASMNAPTYIAELSLAVNRGKMVTYYQLAIVVGIFVVVLATYLIGSSGDGTLEQIEAYNLNEGWRWMFWSELIPCTFFLILLFFVPKSPRWLILKGRRKEAEEILFKIHGEKEATKELKQISESIQETTKTSFRQLFAKTALPIVIIGSVLSALQQLTGINAVFYYGADIFEQALGFGKEDILAQQIILAFVNLLFTFIAMATVDKLGRKPLIYYGCIGMIMGFVILAGTLVADQIGILSLVGILLFIGSFALSMGPIVWVLLSEMFPNVIRSAAMSVAVAVQWAMNYFVSQMFPVVMDSNLNKEGVWNGSLPYFIFIIFIVIILLFTKKYIPETKGKSLEELEKIWNK